ncbi:MAG: NUMOD4 motif-containing HNH endonuclease [Staphylococcus sp.]|uniref:NUMOD4 motif-containing HNH endonuclease n=1 Tax=Staphylococcus sp. TaxID=29387 RepID=UPI003F9A4834
MTEVEIWKDIPGYEGEYQASTLGRIKSLERKSRCGYEGKGFRTVNERILKPGKYCKTGHVSVVLRKKSAGKPVHTLVMLTFKGERPKGLDICHNDGNPTNNALSNLRYDTRTNNNIDIFKHGKNTGNSKLTITDVKKIKRLLKSKKHKKSEIAKMYKVSQNSIGKIANGTTFKWVDSL